MAYDVHTVSVRKGSSALQRSDRLTLGFLVNQAIAAGAGAGLAVSVNVTGFMDLPVATLASTPTITAGTNTIPINNASGLYQPNGTVVFSGSMAAVTGLTPGVTYYIIAATATTITVSATQGGSVITPGGSGTAAPTMTLIYGTYVVQVMVNQWADFFVTGKTATGFTITLYPGLPANTLAAGTFDCLITA